MSVRSRPENAQAVSGPQVTVRALVIGALALLAGVLAWRYPVLTSPVATALATFVILDRLTS